MLHLKLILIILASHSSSLESFTRHFGELINFIYKPDGFMRLYGRSSEDGAVKAILKNLDGIQKSLKEKENESKSNCSKSKPFCSLLWDL